MEGLFLSMLPLERLGGVGADGLQQAQPPVELFNRGKDSAGLRRAPSGAARGVGKIAVSPTVIDLWLCICFDILEPYPHGVYQTTCDLMLFRNIFRDTSRHQ